MASCNANKRINSKVNIACQTTLADWGMFCREVMLAFLQRNSAKIGGPNKTVEIDKSKFGRRKYHRGHPVKGQWVFGGVERESGQTFLVPVQDRAADTLLAVIRDWLEPGTTVISDCWGAYNNLGSLGYEHRTVNHSIWFKNPISGAHTNTIESTWSRVKVFLGRYNRGRTTTIISRTTCSRRGARQREKSTFLEFLHLVANTDWS
jgi:transposase-like protein